MSGQDGYRVSLDELAMISRQTAENGQRIEYLARDVDGITVPPDAFGRVEGSQEAWQALTGFIKAVSSGLNEIAVEHQRLAQAVDTSAQNYARNEEQASENYAAVNRTLDSIG